MAEENKKGLSTCLESIPFAEMMHKMMDHKGVGSLCDEMMKRATAKQSGRGSFSCAEMMKGIAKERCAGCMGESKETKKEEGHETDQ